MTAYVRGTDRTSFWDMIQKLDSTSLGQQSLIKVNPNQDYLGEIVYMQMYRALSLEIGISIPVVGPKNLNFKQLTQGSLNKCF